MNEWGPHNRRKSSTMKRKMNIVTILLFIVASFFGCLFVVNIIHFISNTDSNPQRSHNARHSHDKSGNHIRPLRSSKTQNVKSDNNNVESIFLDDNVPSRYGRISHINIRLRYPQNENEGFRYDVINTVLNEYARPSLRVVHLDFKGAPPKLSYLREIFPLIWKAGGNALLIEYEDMFPYNGPITNASALNAYTRKQIKELISLAMENHLEIIPLVQTFGHMEHVLKLEEFSYLREMQPYPQSLCPSKDQSFEIVRAMIDQIMEMHPESNYIHIGCDEVFQLGMCSLCKEKMRQMQQQQQQQGMNDDDDSQGIDAADDGECRCG